MWETVKLGDVCELQPAKRQVRHRLTDEDSVSFMPMDCLGINEIYPRAENSKTLQEVYSSYTYFEDKDVLLAKITPCFENGKLGIANNLVNGVGFGSSEYIVLRCGGDILPEYVYYHLSQISFRFEGKNNMSGAVGHKRVPKEFVANREISLPPLTEQQRIVAKLDAAFAEIDTAIEVAEAKEAEVEKLKASLLSASLSSDAEVWKTVKLGDVVSYAKTNAKGSGLPYVGMENIASETMGLIGEICVPESTSTTFEFDESHVLFGRLRPYLRKIFVPNFKGQCSTEIFCLKPSSDLSRDYLAYWMLEPTVSKKIEATSTGARMPRANMNKLLEFEFPLPSLAEQQRIVAKLNAAFADIDSAKQAIQQTKENHAALKSAILAQELTPPSESEAA